MTEPSNLRDAAEVAHDCWASADFFNIEPAAAIIEADRSAVEAATIAKVVAWLHSKDKWGPCGPSFIAHAINAGEWKQ